MSMHFPKLRVHAALLAVSVIYGYFYVAVKLLLQPGLMSPEQFILLRFVLTAVVVFVLERLFFKSRFESKADMLKIAGLGLLGVFLVQILVVWGLSLTTAFHSALIMATIPIMTTLISILIGREPFHFQKLAGILIAFAGVVFLLFFAKGGGTPLPETYLKGDLIVLLNAACFSVYLIGSQSMLKRYNSFSFMGWCYIISAILFAAAFAGGNAMATGDPGLSYIEGISGMSWMLVIYVVLFASIGTYTLNNVALTRVSPSIVAVYMFIQPIVSAFSGYQLLGEPFNLQMALATLITFVGVLLTTTGAEKGRYLRGGNVPEALAVDSRKDGESDDEPPDSRAAAG